MALLRVLGRKMIANCFGNNPRSLLCRSYLHPGGTMEFPKGPIPDDIPLSAAFHPCVRARLFIGAMVPWAKLTDPFVLKPARSAVELFNQEQNAKLKFVSLQKAYIQIVCGCKFRFTLEAMDDGVINKYEVEITSDASNGGALELESFKPVADNPRNLMHKP